MNKKTHYVFLILILTIGAFLRVHHLGKESLRTDEAATAVSILTYSDNELLHNTWNEGQILPGFYPGNMDLPPYYVLLEWWTNLFGTTEASFRALSALFGFLSIPLIYLIGRELFNARVALVSSLLLALSLFHITYSQEARLYTLLFFLACLSAFFLIKALITKKNSYLFLFTIVSIIGVYTHYPFIFFIFFEGVYLFLPFLSNLISSRKILIDKFMVAYSAVVLSYVPLLPNLLHPKFVSAHFSGSFSIDKLMKMFLELNTKLSPGSNLREHLYTMKLSLLSFSDWILIAATILLSLTLISLFFHGALRLVQNKESSAGLLLLWFFAPLVVFFIVLFKTIASFASISYVMFILPAYLLIISYAIVSLGKRTICFLLTFIIILSVITSTAFYSNPRYPEYREAVGFLNQHVGKGDTVLIHIYTVKLPFEYYSFDWQDSFTIQSPDDVVRFTKDKDSIWLVSSLSKYYDPEGKVKTYLDQNYILTESKKFYDVDVFHYISKPS